MSFDHILGQKRPISILRKSLNNDTVAHSYLFYGFESIGKRKTAIAFAKSLNCSRSKSAESCDHCNSCRKIDKGIHPDFFLVEPIKNSTSAREGYIRIDQIRDLQKKLNYLPYEGKTKVVIIDSVEKMNPQAANAFLKTLEEPPKSTVLILITSNLNQLLPTIVSRCQGVMFQPLSPEAVRQILSKHEEIDQAELEFRISHCHGQIKRALEEDLLLNNQNREELLDLIKITSFDHIDFVFQWSKKWAKKADRLPSLLDELMALLRDLALLKSTCQPKFILNKEILNRLEPLATQKELSTLLKMFESVLQTKYALNSNLNIQLSLDTMLLNFCDIS